MQSLRTSPSFTLFSLPSNVGDYDWGPTDDGASLVVWKGCWYAIFEPGSEVHFTGGRVLIDAAGHISGGPETASPAQREAAGYLHLSDADITYLSEMADQTGAVRTVSGYGNNETHPDWGASDQSFVRLAPAFYGENGGVRGVVDGVQTLPNQRLISNTIASQDENHDGVEESRPNTAGTNLFLMSFGQFFDHGLDFIQRGTERYSITTEDGGQIVIGRGSQDADGNHINKTAAYVEQSQTYGSSSAITYYLRQSIGIDGDGKGSIAGKSAYLLSGPCDASGKESLPTYAEILLNNGVTREVLDEAIARNDFAILAADPHFVDYRNVTDPATGLPSGQPLLIDIAADANPAYAGYPGIHFSLALLLDHAVGGDGRLNENIALTPIHTVWHREHDFQVDRLRAENPDWSEQKLFDMAKAIVEAEYQHTVFDEFAVAMAGKMPAVGKQGNDTHNAAVNPQISEEFANAVYRVGHSMVNETIPFTDASGKVHQMSLVDAFLNPRAMTAIGVDGLIEGSTKVAHQRIDENLVNAVRNQLLGVQINDLAAINIARGRETGMPSLNELRAYLYEDGSALGAAASDFGRTAAGNPSLKPYATWAEFAANLRDPSLVEQFKAVYGAADANVNKVDLWIGGLAEKPVAGQLGSTFGYVFLEQLDRLRDGDKFYYTRRFDGTDMLDYIETRTFADIVSRNTGIDYLHDNIFRTAVTVKAAPDAVTVNGGAAHEIIVGNALCNVLLGNDGDDTLYGLDGSDTISGGRGDDGLHGGDGNDLLRGGAGDDRLLGAAGRDTMIGGIGDDRLLGGDQRDLLQGEAGDDEMFGEAGNDTLFGGDGDDVVKGGDGCDFVGGGAGNDEVFGGDGNDTLRGASGDDTLIGGLGDDCLDGGEGNDTADYSATTTALRIDLQRGTATLASTGTDHLAGIEDVDGGSANDVIIGNDLANRLSGNAGCDVLYGQGGADLMTGGDGADTLFGGLGNDTLNGGKGDDRLYGGPGNDLIIGGAGCDTVCFSAALVAVRVDLRAGTALSSSTGSDRVTGIENVEGGHGNDVISGNAQANVLHGGEGNDRLTGCGGADIFVLGRGDGCDTVMDFTDGDRIDLTAWGFADCAAVLATATETVDAAHHVVTTLALDGAHGDILVLNGISASSLSAASFIL